MGYGMKKKLSEEEDYINTAMECFGAVWGFDEYEVTDEDAKKIRQRAEEILGEAATEYDKFLDSLGYEQVMGRITRKGKIK